MRSEAFLRQYRVLEQMLEVKYARTARTTSSVVMEFLRDADSQSVREKLDLCREIRNLLTHNAEIDGSPVVEPSEGIVKALSEVVEYVKSPLLALEFATPADKLMVARMHFTVLRLMREMQEKGFSHIPVIEEGAFRGVFSVSTVFSYLAEHPGAQIDEETQVSLFKRFLPVDRHMTERFIFVERECAYPEIKRAFEHDSKRRKRVAAIFVTETGEPSGKLLGLITPWDVLGKVQGEGTLIEECKRRD